LINSIISFGGTAGLSAGSLFVILIINELGIKFTPIATIPGIIMAIVLIKFGPSIFLTRAKTTKEGFLKKIKNLKKTKLILLLLVMFAAYSRDLTFISMLTFMPLYYLMFKVSLNISIIFRFLHWI
jgi:hypothetical protein